jgi:hypothetical protein
MVSKSRFEAAKVKSAAALRRIRQAGEEDGDAMIGVGAGIALALFEKPKDDGTVRKLPSVMGIDGAITTGGALYLLTRKSKNKYARLARQAAIALCTVGANRSTMRGSIKVAGDGSDYGAVDNGDEDI